MRPACAPVRASLLSRFDARCMHSELVIETHLPRQPLTLAARPTTDVEFMQRALDLSAVADASGKCLWGGARAGKRLLRRGYRPMLHMIHRSR